MASSRVKSITTHFEHLNQATPLARQLSDPGKRLQRTPAFRCDKRALGGAGSRADENVPPHVLAQYARVVKPKVKIGKSDAVFSDSGVSSESENIISDDVEEGESRKSDRSVDAPRSEASMPRDENETDDSRLTDTLRKVLKQPLPSGPAPKKPPRTFAAAESSPSKSDVTVSKSDGSRKVPRTREESELMLKKLESVLRKRESSGRVLSPRPVKKTESEADGKRRDEIHYMCTEIFDLNFSDKENALNSSEASLSSVDAANSFAKCLNSLNCASGFGRSDVKYSKFGSPTNSKAPSLSDVCCSCGSTKDKNVSSQNVRLSTFRSSDDSSEFNNECSIHDSAGRSRSDGVRVDESTSTLCTELEPSQNDNGSQYGSIKNVSHSQREHIYAEPYDYIRRKNVSVEASSSPPVATRKQPEDDFGKIREVNTDFSPSDEKFSPDDYFLKDSVTRMKTQRNGRNSSESPPNNASIKKYPFLRSRTRLEDDFGKTRETDSDRVKNVESNRVKDILSRLEGNRGSLKLNKSRLYSKEGVECSGSGSQMNDSHSERSNPESRLLGLHYMSTKIYDIPYNNNNQDQTEDPAPLSMNSSFLYRAKGKRSAENGVARRKPPLGQRRSSCDTLGTIAPHSAIARPAFLNTNTRRGSPTDADKEKLTRLMSDIYDTVAEACAHDDDSNASTHDRDQPSSSDITQASLQMSRTLTEKRKRYVRRMSSVSIIKPAITPVSVPDPSLQHDQTDFIQIQSKATLKDDNTKLFHTCILVGMNFTTGGAFIKTKYPKHAAVPLQIESLVFPEAVDLLEDNKVHARRATVKFKKLKCDAPARDVQNYSFVLTDDKGHRSYAYCRRVLPEGYTHTLPLAYCIIAKYRAPAFYNKVLKEIESHHGSLELMMDTILSQLYNSTFPKCGHSISIKHLHLPHTFQKNHFRKSLNLGDLFNSINAGNRTNNNLSLQTKDHSLMRSFEKIYGHDLKEFQKILTDKNHERSLKNAEKFDHNSNSNGNISNWTQTLIKRPLEPRVDENNLSTLYHSISVQVLVNIFGSLLLERKVIIIGDKLSQLSACLEALQSILFPFVWQHTIISMIPAQLCRDLLEAPVPLLAGLLTNGPFQNECPVVIAEFENINFEEGMLVDISGSCDGIPAEKVLKLQGDESTLLPPMMVKALITSLQLGTTISTSNGIPDDNDDDNDDDTIKARNVLVAEAFLRFFIDIMMGYKQYFKVECQYNNTGKTVKGAGISFDREAYIKSHCSKRKQLFLEWFTETTMFSHFIEQQIKVHPESTAKTSRLLDELPYPDFYDGLDELLLHMECLKRYKELKNSSHLSKHNYKTILNKKVKLWRDKLKDLIN